MTIGIEKVLLVGAVLAFAAEVGSRWWIRQRSRYYMWLPGQRYEMRQDLRVFPQMEPGARIEINADGERGGEVRGNGKGLFRALVAGGSTVECLALDQTTSWPAVLERLLSSPESLRALGAHRVHVGSIGRSGIASRHLDLIFQRLLPQYPRLAAIVVMIGGNDVFQWLAAGTPVKLPPASVTASETFACYPEQRFGWQPKRWAITEVARRLRRFWHPVKEKTLTWVVAARQMRAAAQEMRTTVPDPAAILDRFERHFRRILDRAASHADRVLVVRQPWFETQYTPDEVARCWHGGMGNAWNQHIDVYYSFEVVNDLMRVVDARATAIAEELGVDFLNLRALIPPTLEYYYDFTHFTPAGSALAARAIATALLEPHTRAVSVTRTAPPPAP
jgi:lysophospholipase L1-like esterase